MRALLVLLTAALALLVAITPSAAHAEVWIASYELDVTPDASQQSAHFQLKLSYRTSGEVKKDGFKFVGKTAPAHVRARGANGQLRSALNKEPSSGEWKIDFDVPPDGTVFVEFDQALDVAEGGWSGRVARVGWAPNFKLPIERTIYRVVGGPTIESTTPGALVFPVGARASTQLLTEVAISLMGLIAAIAMVVLRLRSKRREVLATRGIVPPVPDVAYPEGTYRAPPPIVTQGATPDPVLAPEDQKELRMLAVSRVAVVLMTVGIVAFAKPPIRIGFAEAIAAVIAALFAILSMSNEKRTVFIAVPIVMALMVVFAGPIQALVVAVIGALIVGIALAPKGSGGGGSTSTSSCSSGSSCGGGGGGCGGGGGGGGCGG